MDGLAVTHGTPERRETLLASAFATLLQIAGIAAIIWGFALISPVLGFITGGLALILVGHALDPTSQPIDIKSDVRQLLAKFRRGGD